jgi:type VI secretion system protein ImpK
MHDLLIDFLNTLGRLPGCAKAYALRDGLREAQYRRARLKAMAKGSLGLARNTRRAGGQLLAAAVPAVVPAIPAPPPPRLEADTGSETRTVLRLRPGGREPPPSVDAVAAPAVRPDAPLVRGSGLNVLVDAGTELLTLASHLRHSAAQPDLRQLRADLAHKVAAFHAAAREAGAAPGQAITARYALCTLLDEMVLTTPWGADSPWSQHSLLSQFHNETWGGEKFFEILERLLADPAAQRPVLEFMYICLALGLQGRFRIAPGGLARLQDVQARLYQAIRLVRGEPGRELSPRWQGAVVAPGRLQRLLPLWVVAALGALALLGAYAGFSLGLARQAGPIQARLAEIGRSGTPVVAVPAVQRTKTLREALAADIRDGRVDVAEQSRGSTIAIHGDGYFASGSAEIEPALLPLLERIAAALNGFEGALQVAGHTDDQPLAMSRRLRYASNLELSQARADAVASVLARHLARPARLAAEGRGDAQPLVANDTPAHRALNRRVDITLLGADPSPTATATANPALPGTPGAALQRPS